MSSFLYALALRNFRGIGSEWQQMPDFKQFNFFIGPNNAGKSTILNFISRYLPIRLAGGGREQLSIDPLDVHAGSGSAQIEMAVGVPLHAVREKVLQRSQIRSDDRINKLDLLLEKVAHRRLIWVGSSVPYGSRLELRFAPEPAELRHLFTQNEWQDFWAHLTSRSGGGLDDWISESLARVGDSAETALPDTRIVPAVRRIGSSGTAFGDYSGEGLIDRLAQVQSPDHDRRQDREIFDQINGFLQQVTGNEEARIEVPHNREHVLVHMHGRVLPLKSLGTGIEEVIMIAAFCTISQNEIMCIEEPEIHLHPLLQRKLIKYLDKNTSNQYFIATHSAAFIDTPGAAIFHVKLEAGSTSITEALLNKQRHAICVDLGHRASDIIQTNCVIWVEGPSDRIYLKHWIRAIDNSLVEELHYSIMFYGGRLLSHLSADDDEVGEFIGLRGLNRHLAIVIDSDKSSASQRINATKRRIVQEMGAHGGVAWVTKGREIENYIRPDLLQEVLSELYKTSYGRPLGRGAYDHPLHFRRSVPAGNRRSGRTASSVVTDVDKVKVARAVCDHEADLTILDLRKRVEDLVTFIHDANR